MSRPFVIPAGRDFAPRKRRIWRCAYMGLDEVPLSELLNGGLRREVSVYTTHTMADYDSICQDTVYLGNPLFDIKIPCQLEKPEEAGGGLHRPVLVDFHKISQKLWHSFRPHLFLGSSPDTPSHYWHFGTTELRMLRLDLKLELGPEAFYKLRSAFETYHNTTLPLHLYHRWSYKRTKQEAVGDAECVEEEAAPTPVTNVWKDFLVVRRQAHPAKIVLAVASDFHYSERNDKIWQAYPDSVDINSKIEAFAKKAFDLWKDGKIDCVILNGDFIDYEGIEGPPPSDQTDEEYGATNWYGFEQATKILPGSPNGCLIRLISFLPLPFPLPNWLKMSDGGLLSNVPVLWNLGDHDLLMGAYPLAISQPTPPDYNAGESHYNLQGLSAGEGSEFRTSANLTGEQASHVSALRWVHERGRVEAWPLRLIIRVGNQAYNLFLLDTHWMKGTWGLGAPAPPLEPLHCLGLDQETLLALEEGGSKEFTIVIAHAPPVCLAPDDLRHSETSSHFPAHEGTYGTFVGNQPAFLQYLSRRVEEANPVLVISGHVHFRSAYFYRSLLDIATGEHVWKRIERLNDPSDEGVTPQDFWKQNPCLLVTTQPVGPKPKKESQSSGFLMIELGSQGVARIVSEKLEE